MAVQTRKADLLVIGAGMYGSDTSPRLWMCSVLSGTIEIFKIQLLMSRQVYMAYKRPERIWTFILDQMSLFSSPVLRRAVYGVPVCIHSLEPLINMPGAPSQPQQRESTMPSGRKHLWGWPNSPTGR